MAAPAFERKIPPLAMRCGFGLTLYGIIRPTLWALERLGLASRALQAMGALQQRSMRGRSPFDAYLPDAHDVFVVTYPKSGTNWMMQIAHQLIHHGEGEFDHIHSVVPWPDAEAMGMRGYAIPVEDARVWQAAPEKKRVIKTHCNWDAIPYSAEARYIIVIRDPKEVLVSSYFFFLDNMALAGLVSVETWLQLFLSESAFWGPWPSSTAAYWAEGHRPNVLIVSFKSMKQDLGGTVRRVARFLDVQASDEIIEKTSTKASFDYMKQIESKFGMWKMIPWGPETVMLRRGVHGGSSELLSSAQQRRIDARFMAELERLGSDFPYAEFCNLAGP